MAAARKNVLVAGLSKFVGTDSEEAAKFGPLQLMKQKLKEVRSPSKCVHPRYGMSGLTHLQDIENARTAGYDCSQIDVDPDHPDAAVNEIKEKMQSRHWDLFVIGFGIRGNRDFTALFEQAVNACVELSPGTKFGFSPAPDAVFRTILRVLPRS